MWVKKTVMLTVLRFSDCVDRASYVVCYVYKRSNKCSMGRYFCPKTCGFCTPCATPSNTSPQPGNFEREQSVSGSTQPPTTTAAAFQLYQTTPEIPTSTSPECKRSKSEFFALLNVSKYLTFCNKNCLKQCCQGE